MPVLVDRESTRRVIAGIAAGIVAEEGVQGLTSRRLADAAGSSRAIVNTYFTDMRDLILQTFLVVIDRQAGRFEAAQAAGLGLEGCIAALLPMDAARLRDWKVTIAFLGVAASDPGLNAIERERLDSAVDRFERELRLARGVARPTRWSRSAAQHIVSAIMGISIHHCFHADTVPDRPTQKAMIDNVLRGIELPQAAAAGRTARRVTF